jgi:hypothetical protein
MPLDPPKKGESKQDYLNYCIPIEVTTGKEVSQATAICISYYEKDKMSKITDTSAKVMARVKFDTDFKGINLMAEEGDDPCQAGYTQYGMKDMDGREVPNCIPDEKE